MLLYAVMQWSEVLEPGVTRTPRLRQSGSIAVQIYKQDRVDITYISRTVWILLDIYLEWCREEETLTGDAQGDIVPGPRTVSPGYN